MEYKCKRCKVEGKVEEMVMKMGGLLCPHCSVIIFQPYVDKIFFKEMRRRREEAEKSENKQED